MYLYIEIYKYRTLITSSSYGFSCKWRSAWYTLSGAVGEVRK